MPKTVYFQLSIVAHGLLVPKNKNKNLLKTFCYKMVVKTNKQTEYYTEEFM